MSKTNIPKLLRFYSKCIRIITECNYKENSKKENNQKWGEDNNIATIESKLKYYRLHMYYRIRETHSTSYINDEGYINNELKTLGAHVNIIENHINNKDEDILNNIPKYTTLSLIGTKNKDGKILKKRDVPIMDMAKSTCSFSPKLILTAKVNENVDENINIYKKRRECQGCGKIFNSAKLFGDHIRNGEDCPIYTTS